MTYSLELSSSSRAHIPSPPEGVDMIAWMMDQARAKVAARMRLDTFATDRYLIIENALEHKVVEDSLDRCVAMTDQLLAKAKAYLKEPAKPPQLLMSPVQKTEKQRTATQTIATQAAEAAKVDSQQAFSRATALLEVQLAAQVPLPRSSGL